MRERERVEEGDTRIEKDIDRDRETEKMCRCPDSSDEGLRSPCARGTGVSGLLDVGPRN